MTVKRGQMSEMRPDAFKIDRGVPIPRKATGPSSKQEQPPWLQMKNGDSIFIPATVDTDAEFARLRSFFWSSAERVGVEITVRKIVEDGVAGIRAWRVRAKDGPSPDRRRKEKGAALQGH